MPVKRRPEGARLCSPSEPAKIAVCGKHRPLDVVGNHGVRGRRELLRPPTGGLHVDLVALRSASVATGCDAAIPTKYTECFPDSRIQDQRSVAGRKGERGSPEPFVKNGARSPGNVHPRNAPGRSPSRVNL